MLAELLPKRFAQRLCEAGSAESGRCSQFNPPELRAIADAAAALAHRRQRHRRLPHRRGHAGRRRHRRAVVDDDAIEDACRACISSAKWSTSPASSAATTSSGPGPRATRPARWRNGLVLTHTTRNIRCSMVYRSAPGVPDAQLQRPVARHALRHVRSARRRARNSRRSRASPTVDRDTIDAVLEEGARFASQVAFPLNGIGDIEGCTIPRRRRGHHADAASRTPTGNSSTAAGRRLSCDPDYGGQGLPVLINNRLYEMLNSANQAWLMYSGLSHSAYECLKAFGSEQIKRLYLPQTRLGPVERHDVPDRVAVRHRPGLAQDPRRTARRRQLRAQRHQDLHFRRRTRRVGEHPAPGAGATARRTGRERAASRCSWCRNSCPMRNGEAGARNAHQGRLDRAQDGHPRQRDLRDEPRLARAAG